MDGLRFDAAPHPDPTFHFDADPDPNSDPTPSFTHVGKSENFYTFIYRSTNLHCVLGVIIFSIPSVYCNFFGEVYCSLGLHLIKMD